MLKTINRLHKGLMTGIALVMMGVASLSSAQAELKLSEKTESVPAIPDQFGKAGMAASTIMDGDEPTIIALGGANFPYEQPHAEGSKKVFYKDIYILRNNQWVKVGEMPEPLAYSAYAASPRGIVVAGGCNESGHTNKAWLVSLDKKDSSKVQITALPNLPKSLAYPAMATMNNRLYVIGGQEQENSPTALKDIYVMDLVAAASEDEAQRKEAEWVKVGELPADGRILATAGSSDGRIYIMGGCSLKDGKRTYLDEVLVFNPLNKSEQWVATDVKMPKAIAAAATPAPARESCILIIGGDDGSQVGVSPDQHKGQLDSVLIFDTKNNTWKTSDIKWSQGIATAPSVTLKESVYTISGETAPRVRTNLIQGIEAGYTITFYLIDWFIFAIAILVLLILIIQIKKYGMGNISMALGKANDKPSKYAWGVVALLWFVAMLNYFDRQLLTTIREPIVRDIPQTEAQFGLLTAIFLFIYASLSPVGGFLADRFSRRVVIMVSLVVWSAVTWITGHVENYNQLLVARALMGISEACYIPAALALITDFHRGKTRSLATGIHMSGIYTGMAIAGFGGSLSEWAGWRMTFGLFGLVGVLYAVILIIFLKDPSEEAPSELAQDLGATSDEAKTIAVEEFKPSFGDIAKGLFKKPAFWLLIGVMVGSGAANWLVLAWLPTLLKDKFNLSLGDAGIHATFWNSLAKYVAVILGAIIADRLATRAARGRQLVPSITYFIAAPLVFCSAFIGNFSIEGIVTGFGIFITMIAFQGIAQGSLDATLMPILRSHIDERFSATGYGMLNLASAGVGGLTVLMGGKLKDMGFELTTVFSASGVLILVCAICLYFLPKPQNK